MTTTLEKSMQQAKEMLYRKLTHKNFRRSTEVETLIQWLEARANERILDIGCGDGFFDYRIAQESGAHVVGVDISSSALAIAESRNKTDHTEYHAMNAEEMDFPATSFDKVLSCCVIEHFHNDAKVIDNVHRILRPGGLFVFSADSFSLAGVTSADKEQHSKAYAVRTYYTKQILEEKLGNRFAVLESKYILNTPVSLNLARLSWKLEKLPSALAETAYLVYNPLFKALSDRADSLLGKQTGGLTLLVRARKK